MVIPSLPGLPWFSRPRCHARSRLSRSHTSSMSRSSTAGLWDFLLATGGSVPPRPVPGDSPWCPVGEARCAWIFGRVPLMRFESYLPLPIVQAFDQRSRLGLAVGSAFRRWSASPASPTAWPTMPSADFCLAVRASCEALSPAPSFPARPSRGSAFRRWSASPASPTNRPDTRQTSRGKIDRLRRTPVGSTTRALDGYGLCDQLPARPTGVASIRFLYVRPRLCYPLPSDAASRRRPCVLANPSPPSGWIGDLHPQAVDHARHTTKPLRGGLRLSFRT